MLKITGTPLMGLYLVETQKQVDSLGYEAETYNRDEWSKYGLDMKFVQDNQSMSVKGVLRGLHYQKLHPQGKLVRVVRGAVFDVAVDVRKQSETYGKWFGTVLSSDNMKQLYISEGFAHGFYVLSDIAVFCYKTTGYWDPTDEIGIPWNDPSIGIDWPIDKNVELLIAPKDMNYQSFESY